MPYAQLHTRHPHIRCLYSVEFQFSISGYVPGGYVSDSYVSDGYVSDGFVHFSLRTLYLGVFQCPDRHHRHYDPLVPVAAKHHYETGRLPRYQHTFHGHARHQAVPRDQRTFYGHARHQVVPRDQHTLLRDLGVIFGEFLNFDDYISDVCRSTHFHLRNIDRIRHLLSYDACAQLIHALISICSDYCNSLLYNLPKGSIERLQKIQNQAARILTKTSRCDHISKVLVSLVKE